MPYPGDPRDLDPQYQCPEGKTEISCYYPGRENQTMFLNIDIPDCSGVRKEGAEAEEICEKYKNSNTQKIADYVKERGTYTGYHFLRFCGEGSGDCAAKTENVITLGINNGQQGRGMGKTQKEETQKEDTGSTPTVGGCQLRTR